MVSCKSQGAFADCDAAIAQQPGDGHPMYMRSLARSRLGDLAVRRSNLALLSLGCTSRVLSGIVDLRSEHQCHSFHASAKICPG